MVTAADADNASANYGDGVLTIVFPKLETVQDKAKKLEVNKNQRIAEKDKKI